jgi:hypothetical protein
VLVQNGCAGQYQLVVGQRHLAFEIRKDHERLTKASCEYSFGSAVSAGIEKSNFVVRPVTAWAACHNVMRSCPSLTSLTIITSG